MKAPDQPAAPSDESDSNSPTALSEKVQPRTKSWVATQRANLVRYVPSGTYFARLRVGGKLIQKPLRTDKLTVAKMRLGDFEKAEKEKAATLTGATKGKLTFAQALQIYRERGGARSGI